VPYYLGIDGGATKTVCAVGDDSTLLATATTGSSNIVRVGEAQARESLQRAIVQACAAAGIVPEDVAGTCIGAAGAARPNTAKLVRRAVAEIVSSPLEIVGDMQIALEAAFPGRPGVVVSAGSGSIVFGRDQHGRTARSGGWGYAVSDEGSAFWIGRAAVASALRALEANQWNASTIPPAFAVALLKAWGASSLDDVVRIANSSPPPDFAALLPEVLGAPDECTLPILTQAGRELARLAAVVIERLFGTAVQDTAVSAKASFTQPPVPVAMAGGVFRHAALVREAFYNEIRVLEPRAEVRAAIVDPVQGALFLARKLAGKSFRAQG
jgi:N-acetylglucosamine kinase-like BadF-type ATPase